MGDRRIKCKNFESLDAIPQGSAERCALHFFTQKKLKTPIQSNFDTYTANPIYFRSFDTV